MDYFCCFVRKNYNDSATPDPMPTLTLWAQRRMPSCQWTRSLLVFTRLQRKAATLQAGVRHQRRVPHPPGLHPTEVQGPMRGCLRHQSLLPGLDFTNLLFD